METKLHQIESKNAELKLVTSVISNQQQDQEIKMNRSIHHLHTLQYHEIPDLGKFNKS